MNSLPLIKHRKIKKYGIIIATCLIMIGLYSFIPVPEIASEMRGNTENKIVSNGPLTVHFTQSMSHFGTEKAFRISPRIKGVFEWKEGGVLEFFPEVPFEIGERYLVTIGKSAQSIYRKRMESDHTLPFVVTGPPFVKFATAHLPQPEQANEEGEKSLSVIAPDQKITVLFDRPMDTSVADIEKRLMIDPAVKGHLEWIDPEVFEFTLKEWPLATAFTLTVPAGIPARDGGETETPFRWQIETPAPKVISGDPDEEEGAVGLNHPIRLMFNQEVDLNQIRPGDNVLLFPSNDVDADQKLKKDGFFNAEVTYGIDEAGKTNKHILVFSPTFSYLPNREYRFVLTSGLSALSAKPEQIFGALTMKSDFELLFKTGEKPGVLTFQPSPEESAYHQGNIEITFGTAMDPETVLQNSQLTPAPSKKPEVEWNSEAHQLLIRYNLAPSTPYHFVLNDTQDVLGNTVKGFETSFVTSSSTPALEWINPPKNSDGIVFFDEKTPPSFTVSSMNVDRFSIKLCRVPQEDFFTTTENIAWAEYDCETGEVEDKIFPVSLNTSLNVILDLNVLFKTSLSSGPYAVIVQGRPTEGAWGISNRLVRPFVVSNMALYLKRSPYETWVWAIDQNTRRPLDQMPIALFSREGKRLATGTTDENGIYKIKESFSTSVYVRAQNKQYWGLLNELWSSGSSAKSEVAEEESSRLYFNTDREHYLAGEKLYFNGIYRLDDDALLGLPAAANVLVSLNTQDDEILYPFIVSYGRYGSFYGEGTIPLALHPGRYFMSVNIKHLGVDKTFQHLVVIDDIAEKTALEFINPAHEYTAGQTVAFHLKTVSTSISLASGAKGHWILKQKPYRFDRFSSGDDLYSFGEWPGFRCLKYECFREEQIIASESFYLNEKGTADFIFNPHAFALKPGFQYALQVEMEADNGLPVIKETEFIIHPGEYYLGITPKNYWLTSSEPFDLKVISVTPQGELMEGKKITVSFEPVDGGQETILKKVITTTADMKSSVIELESAMKGYYWVKVSSQDRQGNLITSVIQIYIHSALQKKTTDENTITLIPDHAEYLIGGKAHVLMIPPVDVFKRGQKILVTYERGGILGYQILESTGESQSFDVMIKEDMPPNVFIRVTALDEKGNWIEGMANLNVSKREKEIKIDITSEVGVKNGERVATIKLSAYDYQNRPVATQIALKISDFYSGKTISLLDYFYTYRNNQIQNTFNNNGFEVEGSTPFFDRKEEGEIETANQTIYFAPNIKTNEGGVAVVEFPLGEAVYEGKISATAISDIDKFGQQSVDFYAEKSITIEPQLPRFVVTGDRFSVSALLHNHSHRDFDTKIELIAPGLDIKSNPKKNVLVPADSSVTVEWSAQVIPTTQPTLTIAFRTRETFSSQTLAIKPLGLEIIESAGLMTEATFDIRFPAVNGTPFGVTIDAGVNLNVLMGQYLNAMIEKGLPSLEETFNRLMIATVLKQNGFGKIPVGDMMMEGYIEHLRQQLPLFQKRDGGYGLWTTAESSSPVWTAYATLAFYDLKEAPPEGVIDYLWEHLNGVSEEDRVFIFWVLSEMGEYDTKATLNLFKSYENNSIASQAFLLMNFQNLIDAGQKSLTPFREELKSSIVSHLSEEGDTAYVQTDFLSASASQRLNGMVLMVLLRTGRENPIIDNLINHITRSNAVAVDPFDLHSAMWKLLGLNTYLAGDISETPEKDFKIEANGTLLPPLSEEVENSMTVFSKSFPLHESDEEKETTLSLQKDTEEPLFFDAQMSYFSTAPKQANGNHFFLRRQYTPLRNTSMPLLSSDHSVWKNGEVYRGQITLIVPKNHSHVVLEEFFPAGVKGLAFDSGITKPLLRYEEESKATEWGATWQSNPLWLFDHHEIGSDHLILSAETLPAGVYTIDFLVQAEKAGVFHQLPARIYELWNPEIYGTTESNIVEIRE